MEDVERQKINDLEVHSFKTQDVCNFFKGFLERRKAANEALKQQGLPSNEMKILATRAAHYNGLFTAATEAVKGDNRAIVQMLEGGK